MTSASNSCSCRRRPRPAALVRQHRLADDVADREDVRRVGAHLLVGRNEAADHQDTGVLRACGCEAQLDALEFTRSGAAAATINAIAQGETRFGTTQGGTPTSLTFNRISQFQGSIKRAGSSVGNLTSGSVTYSNNLEKIETIRDDGLIVGADPTIAALTGKVDVRFADTTLIDLAAGGTPVDLEFAYTLSASAKLVLTAHEVYLPKPKLAVEGRVACRRASISGVPRIYGSARGRKDLGRV
jgi:Phage tail tube protein